MIEKQRAGRHDRIERYRETGRVVRLVSDEEETTWEDLRTSSPAGEGLPDPEEESKRRNKKVMDGKEYVFSCFTISV